MAVNISAWSIRHPLPPILLAAAIIALGLAAFAKLPVTRMPNVDAPVISVTVVQFGAAPTELESQVTKPIEDAVSSVAGAHHITSLITDGISNTTIIFRLETDTDRAINDVKDAVARARMDLPRGIDEPIVQRVEIAGLPILTYAAIAPGKTPEQLSWFVQDVVVRGLQGVRGVGSVERLGSVDREIRVGLDPVRLQAVGLTPLDVSRQMRGSNVDLAGGRAEIGGSDQAIRTLAGAKTITELSGMRIGLPTGGEVRLDDLGAVADTVAEPRTFARFNGTPVVGVNILRAKGASDVTVADAVAARIASIQAANPDVELKLIDTSVPQTVGNYDSAMQTLYEGAILVVIVVFLFLRDIRATLVAAIALPLSIIPAFWVMNTLGFSLNIVSLLAIILSTGIIIDDAIVEIENIVRHIRMGKSPFQASLDAAEEIGLAVIAISLTIVAVFIPASFMPSIPGQFFKQFGITVSVLVLFSLLCARMITPMLAAYFLKPYHGPEREDGRMTRVYASVILWAVRLRFLTILFGFGLFGLSIYGAQFLASGFLPVADISRSLLAIELPPGSQLQDTEAVTNAISTKLRSRPEVVSVFVDGGRIPGSAIGVRNAALMINFVPKGKRSISQQKLEQSISKELESVPDIRYWFIDENGQRNVTFIVSGENNATVTNVAAEVATQMRRIPSVANVSSGATLNRPELRIYPRRDLAVRLGVSTEALSETIRVATIGDVGPALAKFNAGGRVIPIRVLLDEKARADLQVLEQIRVPTRAGPGVPLNSLADISFDASPVSISRYDRQRQARVEADLVDGAALSDAARAVRNLPVVKNLPPGVTVGDGGDAELQAELFEGFSNAMRNGLLMVYIVLAVLFSSVMHPLTILFSLPLSIAGAVGALLIVKLPITTPVVIGILMLMGIVTKNAIMLIDFAVEAMHAGADRRTAIIEATLKRTRPIVMTTIAMVAGMMPSALAFGAGGEFRSPMAIAVIGGLIASTFLSLLFVPAFFTVMDDVGRLSWKVFGRLLFGRAKPPKEPDSTGAPADQASAAQSAPASGEKLPPAPSIS